MFILPPEQIQIVMSWISRIWGQKKQRQSPPKPRKRIVGIPADNPIKRPEDDVLGRVKGARHFAEQVMLLDVTEGSVVGVLGAWGSGKTSFVNLARTHWKSNKIPVLDFNPWMFSGTEQLVESFFVEVSAQMKLSPGLAEVGKGLQVYGEAFSGLGWVPIVGPWVERSRKGADILGKYLERRKEGSGGRKKKGTDALVALDKPIVVVLDDLDRLTPQEIRDIFKLVRLTANFPNIIYVLAFDRERVEKALCESNIPGRDYLEKILQYSADLPAAPAHLLTKQITDAIYNALSDFDDLGEFDKNAWPDVFWDIIRPLIKNMRDVRRYAMAISAAARELGSQIAPIDLLALEAIRVFLPDTFHRIYKTIDGLTTTSADNLDDPQADKILKDQIDDLIASTSEHPKVVESLVKLRFPGGERHVGGYHRSSSEENSWLKKRRVAHKDILLLYLDRSASLELQAFNQAGKAFGLMSNRKGLETYLKSLNKEHVQDVISSLEVYSDEFVPSHVVPAIVVLLNFLPRLPDRQHDMFDLGSRVTVRRVVYRLLRTLQDQRTVEAAIREILPQVTVLSSKSELVYIVGYQKDIGLKLVSEPAAHAFEKALRDEIRTADTNVLVKDNQLLGLLLQVIGGADATEPPLAIPNSPRVTLALLRSAFYESRGQDFGSRAVYRYPHLNWKGLLELFGDEKSLCKRIEAVRTALPEDEDMGKLLRLADKYCDGWRPNYTDEYLQSHR